MSGMNDCTKFIQNYIFECIRKENAIIEEAVEKSLQTGEHGVLVRKTRMCVLIDAKVSVLVPYGHIYEIREALE